VLAKALQGTASSTLIDTQTLAKRLAQAKITLFGQSGHMRSEDHQFQQPLVVGVMDKLGAPGVKYDVEGSGYGFRVVKLISVQEAQMATSCKMASM